jgi:BlaR1 peptidase M56/Domain of unknown function (DUF3471)
MLLLLLEAALHSILLGVATWLGLTLLRIKDAEAEMMAWKIVLIAAVAMPLLVPWGRVTIPGGQTFLSWLSPHVDASATSVPDLDWSSPGRTFKAVHTDVAAAPALTPGTAAPALEPAGRMPLETIDWLDVATGLYLIISGVLLLKLLIGLTVIFRLARTARSVAAESHEGGRVFVSESISVPATFASIVLLPADCETWSNLKRRAVLAHELSHIARGDFYVLLLAMLYQAAFWFNPLSWWLLHRLRELMEMLSDDAATADVGDAPTYAEVMLEVAASVRTTPMLVGMARASTVRRRIERILARTEPPPSLGRRKRVLLAAGLLSLVAASAVTIASGSPKEPNASVVAQAIVPAQPSQRTVDRSSLALLDGYVGNYERESSVASEPLVFTIIREGGRLLLRQTGMLEGNKWPLFLKDDHTFTYSPGVGAPENELTFLPADRGRVTKIVVHQDGEEFTATRVDEAEAMHAAELFKHRLAGERQPRSATHVAPALFERYVGVYKPNSGLTIIVERDGDQLFLRYGQSGGQRIRIYPESEETYFYEEFPPAQITFVTDQQGQVTELVSHRGGWSRTARRLGEAEARLAEATSAEQVQRLIERRAEERRPRDPIAVDPSVSDRYTGIYVAVWGGRFSPLFTITREGDQLFTQMGGQPKLPIYPEREHAYFYKRIPAQLTFVMDSQGMASQFVLHHNGRDLAARRIGDWPKADAQPSTVNSELFTRYVGLYQLNDIAVVTVTLEDNHLFVRPPGQERFEVFPSINNVYFSRNHNVWIDFKAEGNEKASEIILYRDQVGAVRGTRIDDAGTEKEVEDARQNAGVSVRFIAQQPASGSEAMVRKYLDIARSGAVDEDRLSPRTAEFLRGDFLRIQLIKLGPLQSLSFQGVMPNGFDRYDAKYVHGRAKITIDLRPDGKLDLVSMQAESEGTPGAIVACAQEGTLKSQPSPSLPIIVTIVNHSGGDINLFDISNSGDRYSTSVTPLPPIADGQSRPHRAGATHPLVVTDEAGVCLEIIIPGDSTRTVVIRPKGAAPRSAGGPAVLLPDSEGMLRQYIEGVRQGAPDYERMTSLAADVARQSLRRRQALLAKLGAVQAITFAGISSGEEDIYQIKFDNGSMEWRIDLTPDGKIRRIELGPQ